jgi:hypothetical protein
MNPDAREFLVNEYSRLSELMSTLTTIAYTILSGGVVVFGTLVGDLEKGTVYAYMLALVPTLLAVILGQITHAIYFCYFRLLKIAEEFGVRDDAWHEWEMVIYKSLNKRRFVFTMTQYSGSFPMAVALYFGAAATLIFVLLETASRCWELAWLIALFISVVISIGNVFLTRNRLEPTSFYRRLAKTFGHHTALLHNSP